MGILFRRHRCHAAAARPWLLVFGVAFDVGARRPLPCAAEPAHALDIKEECLALLFAVVADIDAGLGLPRYDRAQRGPASRDNFIRGDAFSARAPNEKVGQIFRPRQASGMRRQNSFLSCACMAMTLFLVGVLKPKSRAARVRRAARLVWEGAGSEAGYFRDGRSSDKTRARPRHRP